MSKVSTVFCLLCDEVPIYSRHALVAHAVQLVELKIPFFILELWEGLLAITMQAGLHEEVATFDQCLATPPSNGLCSRAFYSSTSSSTTSRLVKPLEITIAALQLTWLVVT